ncbi:P-loop containing nucleoside triphosphate hydrolase protein [Obelidium mucronatum]|nr:P-loop containing nucleoside triphosphate hydrolase protein [Obelidium mucronatum]
MYCERFLAMLKTIIVDDKNYCRIKASDTTHNKASHSARLQFGSKRSDNFQTYEARHSLFVIDHNGGTLHLYTFLSALYGFPIEKSSAEYSLIEGMVRRFTSKLAANRSKLAELSLAKRNNVELPRGNLECVDVDSVYIQYKERVHERIRDYYPRWADAKTKEFPCLHCQAFPRSGNGQFCVVCKFRKSPHFNKRDSLACLHHVFGYQLFQDIQETVMTSLLSFLNTSLMVIMPTGSGKTLLLQMLHLFSPNDFFVCSVPTKAVMESHYQDCIKSGIAAAFYNSDVIHSERKEIILQLFQQRISVLFLSPQMLATSNTKNYLEKIQNDCHPPRRMVLFVDEAHNALKTDDIYTSIGHFYRWDRIICISATLSVEDEKPLCKKLGLCDDGSPSNIQQLQVFISPDSLPWRLNRDVK